MAAIYYHSVGASNGQGAEDIQEGLEFDGNGLLTLERKTIEELVAEAVEK